MSFSRKLVGYVKLSLRFETVTGLLIRMPLQAQAYRIGGADQYPMVAKKVYSDVGEIEVPFVPGSSIKGRMRSLIELSSGAKLYSTDQKIWQHVRSIRAMDKDFVNDVLNRCVIDEVFGWAAANYKQISDLISSRGIQVNPDDVFKVLAPTRLLVSDFFPPEDYVKRIGASSVADFLEEKSENRIDRITSAADPRDIVRVRPGVEFEGDMTLLLFDIDRDYVGRNLGVVAMGLKLLEDSYIGASGSRGYGRVRFTRIGVTVYRIEVGDVPRIVPALQQIFGSVEEFISNVGKLAETVKNEVYKASEKGSA